MRWRFECSKSVIFSNWSCYRCQSFSTLLYYLYSQQCWSHQIRVLCRMTNRQIKCDVECREGSRGFGLPSPSRDMIENIKAMKIHSILSRIKETSIVIQTSYSILYYATLPPRFWSTRLPLEGISRLSSPIHSP